MNLVIKLPPRAERDELVKSWVKGVDTRNDFSDFRILLDQLVQNGHNHNGIACLILHDTTTRLIRQELASRSDSPWIDAAFGLPIGLN